MAYGQAEDPALSIPTHLDSVDYPVWREQLVKAAADNGAPTDLINVFKSLPRTKYESKEEVMRDLAEAARRFASGGLRDDDGAVRDRRNIGRDMVENAPPGHTRHP
ncbi:DUF2795 domain-containing protein [Hyalangium rubrum]|uniref:DUF2795 domain-containing protein n=1 Tax=Hyalangium rubrum TaxID=3103134 RepID=A0ABU5HA17_9BACT|nr:DUF2795 domain-containing protein [Hyalangium sp. s54d21]MDY7228955.1 DUF2795 domain-containing protein [Hyalangium sp. s54d21]